MLKYMLKVNIKDSQTRSLEDVKYRFILHTIFSEIVIILPLSVTPAIKTPPSEFKKADAYFWIN